MRALDGPFLKPGRGFFLFLAMNLPNFTGNWTFDREASTLEITPPDSSIFNIVHREPQFHLERTHRVGDVSDTFSIDLTTDGREMKFIRDETEVHARLFWENETLAFHSELRKGDQQGSNNVRYRLTNGGKTFIAEEVVSFGAHRHKNVWVFNKESGEDP